jgi:hypothetical protein
MQIISRYQKRISGPLLDRHAEACFSRRPGRGAVRQLRQALRRSHLRAFGGHPLARGGGTSAAAEALRRLRAAKQCRYAHVPGTTWDPAEIREICMLDGGPPCRRAGARPVAGSDAAVAAQRAGLSPHSEAGKDNRRAFAPLRASLTGAERIETPHLAEAIQCRPRRMV